jgi:predicted transcriptional regulator
MKSWGAVIAVVLILFLAYAHQASVDSNIIVTPSEDPPDLLREDHVWVLNWWEISPINYFFSFIAIHYPFLIPVTGIVTVLASLSFGIRQIENKNVLENERREDIFRLITENPGITQAEVEHMAEINRSSLRYHLKMLMREEKIISKKVSKKIHYFENHNGYIPEVQVAKTILDSPTAKNIYSYIYTNPGCTQKDLAEYMNLSCSTISWHIERLSSGNLVKIQKESNFNHYYVANNVEMDAAIL